MGKWQKRKEQPKWQNLDQKKEFKTLLEAEDRRKKWQDKSITGVKE